MRIPKEFATVVYVLISLVLVAVEEIVIAYEIRKQIVDIDKNNG